MQSYTQHTLWTHQGDDELGQGEEKEEGADLVESTPTSAGGEATGIEETEEKTETPQARVLLLVQEKLPECMNRQRCDEFCVSFCNLNSKGARKRLVQVTNTMNTFTNIR